MEQFDGQFRLRQLFAVEDEGEDLEVQVGGVDDLLFHTIGAGPFSCEVDESIGAQSVEGA